MITAYQVFRCSQVSRPCRVRVRVRGPDRSWCRWTTHLGRRKAVRNRVALHGNNVQTTPAYLVAYATMATFLADAGRVSGNIRNTLRFEI